MTTIRIERLALPGVELGPPNPFPRLGLPSDPHARRIRTSHLPKSMAENVGYGRVANVLPYLDQDDYGRTLAEVTTTAAVLENDILRATFLLARGGRLWSLVDRRSGRELLFRNPVFQLANLGLRNAWFAGGIEWNPGTIGHSPLTCEPVFAARVEARDATPVLRLWEWERLRETPFQLDFYLPPGSPVLFVFVRIVNPNEQPVPIYWWTNIAVRGTPDTQVLVPTDAAYLYRYQNDLPRVPYPVRGITDLSFPAEQRWTSDLFFDIPREESPWIGTLDSAGRGLLHTSTEPLHGRKLFAWGRGDGGRNWQRVLSGEGESYFEIQAGLATTQLEHVPLPAGGALAWTEAINPIELHSASGWVERAAAVREFLDAELPRERLARLHREFATVADEAPSEVLHLGTGWGALDRHEREASGTPAWSSPGIPYPDGALGAEQQPWLELVNRGQLPPREPRDPPASHVRGQRWRERLDAAPETWETALHLGVLDAAAEDWPSARRSFERSLALARTPWALRNLAYLDQQDGSNDVAAARYRAALDMLPGFRPLVPEAIRASLHAGRPGDALAILEHASASLRGLGRLRLLEAIAALQLGDVDRARRFFEDEVVVADLREGDNVLEDLWAAIETASGRRVPRPVPKPYRFRMRPGGHRAPVG